MKKGTKIITTVVAMCLVITAMVVGIWAATQQVGAIGATVNFDVKDVKMRSLGWTEGSHNSVEDGNAYDKEATPYYRFAAADVAEPEEGAPAQSLGTFSPDVRFDAADKGEIVIYYVVQNLLIDKAAKFDSTLTDFVTGSTPENLDVTVRYGVLPAMTVTDGNLATRVFSDTNDAPDTDFTVALAKTHITTHDTGGTALKTWTSGAINETGIVAQGGLFVVQITLEINDWGRSFELIKVDFKGIFTLVPPLP